MIVLDHLSAAQRRALVIADNKLALNAGWNEAQLRVEIEALEDMDFNLDLVRFSDDELADLLSDFDPSLASAFARGRIRSAYRADVTASRKPSQV